MHDFTEQRLKILLEHLRKHVDGEVRFDTSTRWLYATDASLYQIQPTGVVIPRTTEALHTTVQIALETHTPIVPRGGGTSLSGQSIGAGIVIDCSKYLNRLLDIDPKQKKCRVQPGMVLDQLNRELSPYQLQFGPDVSTASRATLGGMIGNNSAGSRSVVYGKTSDHILSLQTILHTGEIHSCRNLSREEWERAAIAENSTANLYRTVQSEIDTHRLEIDRRFPKIVRRVSGYNLGRYIEAPEQSRSLLPLLIGSEGTLGFVTEAELNLVPKPRHRGLLIPHFDPLQAALDHVGICLEFQPSAVELMDSMLIELARHQHSLKETMSTIQGRPAALLMVEFQHDDLKWVTDRIEKLQKRLTGARGMTAQVPALEASLRDPLWNLRRAAVPLLFNLPGEGMPTPFVEDTAVAPEKLPEFTRRFREILQKHNTDGAFYGHASVGCLHIRPVLNLKTDHGLKQMRAIAEEITDLVLEYHGSLSGEHGDGLARSEWNRKMYGDVIYESFRRIKQAFDPNHLFNPGKIVDAPSMTENLRMPPSRQSIELPTIFDYSRQQNFFHSIEVCNGSGVCRKTQGGTMCPSYRATGDEIDSTRGRANALRMVLTESTSQQKEHPLNERWLFDVMDLCLSCKACKSECPSNVDLAKLKSEFLQAYYDHKPRPLSHYFLSKLHRLNRQVAPFAPVINWMNRRKSIRWLIEKLTGIDRRRPLPHLHRNHVRRWFSRRPMQSTGRKVLVFDDCFTTYQEPHIGIAAIEVLEKAGCSVELVNPICCGRTLISKGFLREARELARIQIPLLLHRIESGIPILGLEPSCILTLKDEWPELVPTAQAKKLAEHVHLAESWLAQEIQANRITLPLKPSDTRCVFHGHCHQKATCGIKGTEAAIKLIPNQELTTLDAGCCGMAGAFGYEKEHFDLSVKIASLSLIPSLEKSPDSTIIATGTSCRHQIHDLTGRKAKHPMELLRDQLET